MSTDKDPLNLIGVTVDQKYQVAEFAGEGGFSVVYKATHLVWNEPVAIKFFTLLETANEELREKLLSDFIQEGKLMSQLSSRTAAIVQARDIGKLERPDGSWLPYMVLEWLTGTPLDLLLRSEQNANAEVRAPSQVVQLLEPAATALDLAHEMGVAHRDLKPANIFVVGDVGRSAAGVKVLDFGIAKVMSGHQELHEQLQLTTKQTTAFTPAYGAPEQFSRKFGATGPWTDVYAMALIMIELMCGRQVLEGKTYFELGVETSNAALRPTPRNCGVTVSDPVEAVFARALAVLPSDRYARMGDFWDDLLSAAFPEGAPWRGGSTTTSGLSAVGFERTSQSAATVPGLPSAVTNPTAITATNKSRLPLLLGVGIAAALLGGGIWLSMASAGSGSDPPTIPIASSPAAPGPSARLVDATSAAPAEPSAEASATASVSADPTASANLNAPSPRVANPLPARPQPTATAAATAAASTNKTGGNAWDPTTFGGRR